MCLEGNQVSQTDATPDFGLGEWLVQPGAGRVSRGLVSVRIRQQAMNLLVYLAGRFPRTCSHGELSRAVWEGRCPGTGVARCVAELRDALRDDARRPRLIETIPRRGYRVLVPATPLEAEPPVDPAGGMPTAAEPGALSRPFEVNDWLVEPGAGRLWRRGACIHLRRQLMNLLLCLASRRGTTVSRRELFETVWSGHFVAPTALARCVAELRNALGDSARGGRVIETVPKRGYRLVAAGRPPARTTVVVHRNEQAFRPARRRRHPPAYQPMP